MPQKITFHKASSHWKETIFKWLEEPHVQEFWDTSKEYKNDILLFMEKRVQPSSYCNGIFDYWIAFFDNIPYALIMTSEVKHSQQDLDATWRQYLTKNGKTITLDFMIGNTNYLHRNLAGTTLNTFTEYMQELDPSIKTFLIDPDTSNIRAKHAYEKAGFIVVSTFIRHQKPHFLMVKNSFSIQKAPPTKEKEIFSFLEHHEEYSLFLMNNLISYGYVMTENPNSANFYSIFEDDDIIGFFGLTRKGILLMDCNRFEAFPWILECLKKEKVPLKGIMGEWVACSAFWDFLKEMGFITQVTFEEKEILYSLDTGKKRISTKQKCSNSFL